MLEYSPSTSRVTQIQSSATIMPSNFIRTSLVSLMNEGRVVTNGLKILSTYELAFSVRLPIPETIVLPGGGVLFLWTLGRL
ncbi:hypothetical protein FKM82_021789 [Ascaphus truei]